MDLSHGVIVTGNAAWSRAMPCAFYFDTYYAREYALTPNPSPRGRGEKIYSPLPRGEGLGVRA